MLRPSGEPIGEPLENVPTNADFAFGLLNPASDHALARLCPFWQDVWDRNTTSWVPQTGQYDYTPDDRAKLLNEVERAFVALRQLREVVEQGENWNMALAKLLEEEA